MKRPLCIWSPVAAIMFSIISISAWSAPKTTPKETPAEENLRARAVTETEVIGTSQKGARASEAQVTGMLTLKDPRPEAIGRSWVYYAGLSAQSFQPEGTASNSTGTTFDFSNRESSVMPAFELGVLSRPYALGENWALNGGIRLRGSFTSQQGSVVLASGYEINDARLSSSLLSGGLILRLSTAYAPRWGLTVSPQTGVATYTQTSSNDYADFSQSFSFDSLGFGVDFAVSKRWTLFTEWTQRTARNPGSLALQNENLELGAKVQW